jgi:DNA-binding MarR family transcriptional regulator
MTLTITASRLEKKRKAAVKSRTIPDRHGYFSGVAQARFVLRKVFRLIEEQAKLAGLDPLEHQALIQIYGSSTAQLRVKEVAERLDIAPAFASNVLKALVEKGHVVRIHDAKDQRVTFVAVTARGKQALHRIDEQVQAHVDYFTRQLSQDDREAALSIMMFYIGISLDAPSATRA